MRNLARRQLLLAVTIVAGMGFAACGGSSPTVSRTPDDPPPPPPPPPPPTTSGLVTNFVWVGTREGRAPGRQFSDAEFEELANNFDFVVIAAFHCGGVRECHNEAARRLKEMNPDMTVLAYMNARLREFEGTNQLELFGSDTFDTAWFLRHQETGEILEVSQGRGGVLDLAQPALRQWMLDQIQGWLADAPFDGIAFDRVQGVSETSTVWLARIGLEKIRALNRAEIDLVNEVSTGMGSDKLFVYNGLKDASSTLEGRIHTEPLGPADGVANEYFCYHKDFAFLEAPGFSLEQSVILEIDAHLSAANDGKVVLVHVTYQDDTLSQAEKDVINRMCYGSFLLGHRPGFTSYKFGFLTTQRVLDENAAEQSIQFGEPFGAYVSLGGGLYSREFANGIVVVNLGVSPSSFQVPFASVLMNGGVAGQSFAANTTATVPARDTLFLVRQ